ncbi:MAG: phenylalanine--tRNA ligase subunit alpha [Candidatus Aenigmatarchaeota archaeon]|nr:phenylalanine--tRNA ligase subunit alpha [Candidatus Aenigmarchaeota archaeon]
MPYVLTNEGKEFLSKGLPERHVLTFLRDGRRTMAELATLPGSAIGIGWARKAGWIRIIDNLFVELTDEGRIASGLKLPMERALEDVERSGETSPENAQLLLSRGLIRQVPGKAGIFEKIIPRMSEISLPKHTESEYAQLTPEIIKTGRWKEMQPKKYDVNAPAPQLWPGKRHIVQQFLEKVRRIWIEMGFKEMTGNLSEVAFWNFDALYQPQDHPARDLADTFYLNPPESVQLPGGNIVERVSATHTNGWTTGSTGWKYKWSADIAAKACLRTHTTCLSARTLAGLRKEDLPAKYFAIGRCFRNETLDWKHLCEFYQVEGIVVDESVTFRHLLGYLKRFYAKLGFPNARFRPAYFPYTEMSTEIEVWDPYKKVWLELGGAGIFRPEVVKPLMNIDIPVLAWGPGVERLVMNAYNIADIRQLYGNDLALLRGAKMW